MLKIGPPYDQILNSDDYLAPRILLQDHLGGFDVNHFNPVLSKLDQGCRCDQVIWHQVLDPFVKCLYPNLKIEFSANHQHSLNFSAFHDYRQHPDRDITRFLCSFNGSAHVSRKFLVAILHRMGWFDPTTCSKNLQFSTDKLDGHLADFLDQQRHRAYRPFFLAKDSDRFFNSVNSFGHKQPPMQMAANIYNLENQITRSFLHIVSESMATSYHPFVTEKFLYSVITRGLFLAYAQPDWHDHLERYYGFRKYERIFDYRFDAIQNPVERLVELMSMISKFSVLSPEDWRDLYEIESDTIEYNYDHYFSGRYLEKLRNHE